ncbi:MAG TPA: GDSL-type esterase/lipase family protein [Chitinispirillaceae bacterium]|nr:GDSL-type esterase/lipase family protein [Chitinispirillaceae bacterium]
MMINNRDNFSKIIPSPQRGSQYSKFQSTHMFILRYIPDLVLFLIFQSFILLFLPVSSLASSDSATHWVGTWAAAPYKAQDANKPPVNFDNYTVRQLVKVSIGGDTVRVKFSNITCTQPVIINKVNIAISPDSSKSPVLQSSITDLKFKGNAGVTINAKSEEYSDPVAFKLEPGKRLAITIYYKQCKSTADMTFHYGSRTNSYYLSGDKTTSADFGGSTTKEAWYTISAVEVLAPNSTAAVAFIGNSITDGNSLHNGQWKLTDAFAEKLLKNKGTEQVGVLNLGIGATMVTGESNGADPGVKRFDHDILQQSGVRWVVIFYGVNDINANVNSTNIINGFKSMIQAAHAKNCKVYCATITPFKGHDYYDAAGNHEKVRSEVNKWIRTDKSFDGYFDFDKIVRNPGSGDTTKLQQQYSADWLHPNAAGYKAIGESIDPKLFEIPVSVEHTAVNKIQKQTLIHTSLMNGAATINFNLSEKSVVTLMVYTMQGKKIAELAGKSFNQGPHTLKFEPANNASQGMYVCTFKAGKYTESKTFVFHGR